MMVGNPQRYQAALHQLENRHATAGCLLALLFVIPFAARSCNVMLLMSAAILYVLLVVPVLTGYISLGTIIHTLRMVIDVTFLQYILQQVWLMLKWLHELYCSLQNIQTTATQVLFFVAAEKALCPEQRFVSLYGLLFCTMLAYLYQSLQSRHWAQIIFTTTTADFLRLTTAFIIIRLGKGVAMSFILISITLQFDHLEPSTSFIFSTGLYFIITQFLKKSGKENIVVTILQQMDLHLFEGLEEYWVPLLMSGVTVLLTLINIVIAVVNSYDNILWGVIIMYTNVLVVMQQVKQELWLPLQEQHQILANYPLPTRKQLAQRDDNTCAVCLDDMSLLTARITPCCHIFHGQCLRRCVLQYQQCPLCKKPLPIHGTNT